MPSNKWKIEVFVTGEGVDHLTELLDAEIRRRGEDLIMVSDEQEYDDGSTHIAFLRDLQAQIKLSWIESEEELIPPPNEHSAHLAVVIDHSEPSRRDA